MCRYNTVQFFRRLQLQNVDQTSNSQQTPHISPSRASYGLSVVRILEKNDHVIMVPHWTYTYTYADNDGTNVIINPVDAMAACISRLSAGYQQACYWQHGVSTFSLRWDFKYWCHFRILKWPSCTLSMKTELKNWTFMERVLGDIFICFVIYKINVKYMWHEISFSDLMVYINTGIAWLCAFSLLTHLNFKRHIKLAIFFFFT